MPNKKKRPEKCYLLMEDGDLFFIPAEDFMKFFILDEKTNTAYEDTNVEWNCMSGGLDTFMQGCWFQHARSSLRYGSWKDEQKTIVGVYRFSVNRPES